MFIWKYISCPGVESKDVLVLGLGCLTPLSTFKLYRGGQETGVPGKKHRPVASH